MSEITHDSIKRQRLGRGLNSLISNATGAQNFSSSNEVSQPQVQVQTTILPTPSIEPQIENNSRIWKLPVEKLEANEYQPRRHFAREKLEELATSIKENGVVQPIVARKKSNGRYEIIAGERRWRASQLAGLREVPVILKDYSNQESLQVALIENIQREDLNPIEEAEAFQRLAQEFHLTQQSIAERVGKERATVANAIRLLALPEVIKQFIAGGSISTGHAKALLVIPDTVKQIELGKRIVSEKLTVRTTEKLASEILVNKTKPVSNVLSDEAITKKLIIGLAEEMQKLLGTKVSIEYTNKKGRISIQFYGDEQLTNIIEKLRKGCQS